MATTYTWIGASGTAFAGNTATDWSPTGHPQQNDTAIVNAGGSILLGDGQFTNNTGYLNGGAGGGRAAARLIFSGDEFVTFGNTGSTAPSLDATSIITTATAPGGTAIAGASIIDALGNFINEGSILAAGPAGSSLTINVGATTINGTLFPGYAFNPGLIEADAGNTLTIAVGASSELLNSGSVVANGGTVVITADPSAVAGGVAAVAGFYVVKAGGTLETQASYPLINGSLPGGVNPRYEFGDATSGNTLKIDNLGSFGGAVVGFQAGDTVDLGTSIAVGTLVYSTLTGLLILEDAAGTILDSLFLSTDGMATSGTFAVSGGAADGIIVGTGADGDTILTTNRTFPSASGASGTWQTAASWNGGSVPATADTAVIGLNSAATFTITTGAAPVSVLGISIFDSQASLQITSNTTATPGIANIYAGTLEVTSGNTLTSTALRSFDPGASIVVNAGGTADVTGRPGTALAAQAGTYTVTQGNSSGVEIAAGTLVIDGALIAGPTKTSNGGNFTIGQDGAGTASVTVNGDGTATDGQVTDTYSILGSDPTSAGSLTLNGAGASWTDTIDPADPLNSRGFMLVGFNNLSSNSGTLPHPGPLAAAQLLVENGATLADQGGVYIADSPGSAANVTVTSGGFWNLANNSSFINNGTTITNVAVGFLRVGFLGSGTLSVLNGGSVAIGNIGTFLSNGTTFTNGGISVGSSAGATGTLIVSGAGSHLSSLDGMSVGNIAQGLLSIVNGGTVSILGNGIGVGQTAAVGSSGTIQVGGSGATAALNFATTATGMTVGNGSTGTLTVSDNGTVNLNGAGGLTVGSTIGSSGLVTVGGTAASAVINLGTRGITVGGAGAGTLQVNSFGTINETGTTGIGIGQTSGAVGVITVSGGMLTEGATTTGMGVGQAAGASGTLNVINGGTVSIAAGSLGIGVTAAASNGTVTVSGTGSLLKTTGTTGVNVGSAGQGTLTVNDGALASIAGTLILGSGTGSSGTATVTGATLSANALVADFNINHTTPGTLTIGAGGVVTLGNGGSSINNNGGVVLAGGTFNTSNGAPLVLNAGGQLGGFGKLTGLLNNLSTITASGGTLEIASNLNGSLAVSPGATMKLDAGGGLSGKVSFSTGGPETVIFQGSLPTTNTFGIANLQVGDRLELPAGNIATGATLAGTTLTVNTTTSPIQFTNVTTLTGVSLMFNTGTDTVTGETFVQAANPGPRTLVWTGAAGTDASNAGNWNDLTDNSNPSATPPGALDTAEFLSNGGTVTGTMTAAVLQSGSDGLWTFNSGASLTAGTGISIGNGQVDVTGGASLVGKGSIDDISGTGGEAAAVAVSGTNSSLSSAGSLFAGDAGLGNLSIQASGRVAGNSVVIANTTSASGSSINVTGANSNLQLTGSLIVGNAGFGQLSVAQGATVTGTTLTEGAASGGSGVVSVAGTGSGLNLTGALNVGGLAPGELSILNGGEVTAASVTIGAGAGGIGNLVIGTGGTLTLTGTTAPVVVGPGAAAVLNIQGGTLVLAGGSPTFGPNGRLVQVGGKIDPAQTLTVAGNAFGGGAIDEASVEVLNTATAISKAPDISGGSATFLAPLVTGGTALKPGIWNIDGNGTVGQGGTLVLDVNTVAATQEFSFADATGVLEIGQQVSVDAGGTPSTINAATLPGFLGLIDSYVTGDQIIVETTAAAGFGYAGGDATITVNDLVGGTQEGVLTFTDPLAAAQAFADRTNATAGLVDHVLPCFAAGTRIGTVDGAVRVEDLRVGDMVTLASGGSERIVWIGSRAVDCTRHPRPETVWPIRIRRGAFGENVPVRDLYLSPDHAVFVNDVLVPVKLLVNGTTIARVKRDRVRYLHVELRRHDVVLAEGLTVESYLDVGDRANFGEGGAVIRLFPDFAAHLAPDVAAVWETEACAELVTVGERLDAIRRHLNSRALQLRKPPGLSARRV